MKKYLVPGGVRLEGTVKAEGAKNAALPLMAACLLVPGPVILKRIPRVQDILTMAELLELLGVKVENRAPGAWLIDASQIGSHRAPYELVSRMRASIYIMGPLLARLKRARVALPGGCSFGPRPVNFHMDGLRAMGASLDVVHGEIVAETRGLRGADITLPFRSVGATAHLIMAGVLAQGRTVIRNPAREPEVVAVAEFLRSCGAEIEGEGTDTLRITGVRELVSPGEFVNIPDRIEAGTLAVGAFMTRGRVRIEDVHPPDMRPVLDALRAMAADIQEGPTHIVVAGETRPRPLDITTEPHPGFPTDMQSAAMAALSLADGLSVITETIYPDRFKHAFELLRLGADISVEAPGRAVIRGVRRLTGAPVQGTDLRATAALVLAGLAAEGQTLVSGIEHLDRGYEDFPEKMRALGAAIEVITDEGL